MNGPGDFHFRSEPIRVKLRADDFWLLAEGGALDGDGKIELIDGEIYRMNSQLVPHALVKSRLGVALAERLKAIGSELEMLIEVSVDVAEDSVPQPDIVVISLAEGRRLQAQSIVLAVEVSDTTLHHDRGRKAELYAAAAIPEYWVVDISGRRVLVFDRPDQGIYGRQGVVPFGKPIVSTTIPEFSIGTDNLFF